MDRDGGVEDGEAGTSDGANAVRDAGDPGDGAAVVEAQGEGHGEIHAAADAFDDADDIGVVLADGHEVDEAHAARLVFEGGFENEGVVAIFAGGFPAVAGGADLPAAVFVGAEQGGKAGAGGKVGPAEPVDGALAIDQGRSLTIANEGIVFNRGRQGRGHRETYCS